MRMGLRINPYENMSIESEEKSPMIYSFNREFGTLTKFGLEQKHCRRQKPPLWIGVHACEDVMRAIAIAIGIVIVPHWGQNDFKLQLQSQRHFAVCECMSR